VSYQQVVFSNWPKSENPPYDVQGICCLSELRAEYLIVESGFKRGWLWSSHHIRYPSESVAGRTIWDGSSPFPREERRNATTRSDRRHCCSVHDGMTGLLLATPWRKRKPICQSTPGSINLGYSRKLTRQTQFSSNSEVMC